MTTPVITLAITGPVLRKIVDTCERYGRRRAIAAEARQLLGLRAVA